MNQRQFLDSYARLQKAFATNDANPGSYQCVDSRRCASCMFCRSCEGCYRCTHCVSCVECSNSVHCTECHGCHGCTHCVRSRLCTGSAYLTLCENLSDCTYCFGCVGLTKKDFHILNEPYDRKTWFEVVRRLKAELGIPA